MSVCVSKSIWVDNCSSWIVLCVCLFAMVQLFEVIWKEYLDKESDRVREFLSINSFTVYENLLSHVLMQRWFVVVVFPLNFKWMSFF